MRLIDADAIVTLLRQRSQTLKGIYGDIGGSCSGAAGLIGLAPTIDAVPVVHGHWIWSDDLCEYCCSRCGHTDDYGIHPDIEYCPYCGALMDQVVVDE